MSKIVIYPVKTNKRHITSYFDICVDSPIMTAEVSTPTRIMEQIARAFGNCKYVILEDTNAVSFSLDVSIHNNRYAVIWLPINTNCLKYEIPITKIYL